MSNNLPPNHPKKDWDDWNEPPQDKPDIDDLLGKVKIYKFVDGENNEVFDLPPQAKDYIKQALYHRLAAEAVEFTVDTDKLFPMPGDTTVKAIPLSKLKAIMEIKE